MIRAALLALCLLLVPESQARTRQGAEVGMEVRAFSHTGIQGQEQVVPSARFQYEFFSNELTDNRDNLFEFRLHARVDEQDDRRERVDVREASWIHVGSGWEFRLGIRKVFWGVLEGAHLVDIVNQTDAVEQPDGEDKLGQPMLNLSWVTDYGIFDVFLLPWFRERTFPGPEGRLRVPLDIDYQHPLWDSGAEHHRVDFAARWSHSIGDVDIGISHFSGTSREPVLVPRVDLTIAVAGPLGLPPGPFIGLPPQVLAVFPPTVTVGVDVDLVPQYQIIDQTGVDAQYIWEDWAFKLEAFSRVGEPGGRFAAAGAGFEYTRVGIFESRIDLGLVFEYYWDERGDTSAGFLEHDVLLATRWAFNDIASSEILAGMFWDHETEERIFSVEASRRLGGSWKLTVESRVFMGDDAPRTEQEIFNALVAGDVDKKLLFLQDDDFLQIELIRYF